MYMKPRRPFSVAAVAAVCVCFAAFLAPARETGWRVAELNGAPGLYRDGQPVAPVLFWQWELLDEDVRAMAGAGVDLFATFGSFGHYGASTSRGTPLRRSAARPWRRPASPTPPRP